MEEVKAKKKKSGLKVLLIILLILIVEIIMFIVGQYTSSKMDINLFKTEISENKKSDNKVDEKEESTNEEKILEEITKVYREAFDNMTNSDNEDISIFNYDAGKYVINKSNAEKYFTEKAIAYLEHYQDDIGNLLLSSIFNVTDQGKRPLKILTVKDDTVIVTGQIVNGVIDTEEDTSDWDWLSDDQYPLYIIYKNVNGTYKIDSFE